MLLISHVSNHSLFHSIGCYERCESAGQNEISDGGISDMIMPIFYGKLSGNKARGIAVVIFNRMEKVPSSQID